jgi:hypothetical protein
MVQLQPHGSCALVLFFLLRIVRPALDVARIVRGPLLVTLVAGLLLCLPAQTLEVYRVQAQDLNCAWTGNCPQLRAIREPIMSAAGLALLAATLWYLTRQLIDRPVRLPPTRPSWCRVVLRNVPSWLSAAVPIVAAVGVLLALPPSHTQEGEKILREFAAHRELAYTLPAALNEGLIDTNVKVVRSFASPSSWHYVIAMVLALAGLAVLIWTPRARLEPERTQTLGDIPYEGRAIVAMVAVLVLAFWLVPVRLAQGLGSIAVLCLFASMATLVLAAMSRLGDRLRVPLISGALVVAAIIGFAGSNSNHDVRQLEASTSIVESEAQLKDQLKAWLVARKDKCRYRTAEIADSDCPLDRSPVNGTKARYPIYIVAAQGGGVYAAYHAARTLGVFSDRCPAFTQHLFAVSGVSGGSVGSAIYTSLNRGSSTPWPVVKAAGPAAAEAPCVDGNVLESELLDREGSLGEAVDYVLDHDLLSPLLGAMLFPDFAQRFWPFPIDSFDRARAIEYALEDAVADALVELDRQAREKSKTARSVWTDARNVMRERYSEHWSPDASSPALIFNATSIRSGERKVLTPFVFGSRGDKLVPRRGGSTPLDRISLSTAAFISSRFPWVTPSARLMGEGVGELGGLRLVDGGYYDNSGVATAVELKESIEKVAGELEIADKIAVHLIVLTAKLAPAKLEYYLQEILDPVRAMLGSWQQRAQQTVEHTQTMLNGGTPGSIRLIHLEELLYPFPLGWRLSDGTRYLINVQDPVPGIDSAGKDGRPVSARFQLMKLESDRALDAMIAELK